MPLYNWRKCQEGNELIYTRVDLKKGSENEDIEAWDNIYDTFLLEFGLGKDYERILDIRTEIALLQCEYVIEDNKFLLNRIKQLEIELKDLVDKPNQTDLDTTIIYIEKWMGFAIREKETTVRKFYKLLREYQKYIEESKKAG